MSYDAFANVQPPPIQHTSYQPHVPQHHAVSSSSSSSLTSSVNALHVFDETAADWIARDSTQQSAPAALRSIKGGVKLWNIIPAINVQSTLDDDTVIDSDEDDDEESEARAQKKNRNAREANSISAASIFAARQQQQYHLQPTLHAGDVLEIYGKSQAGKTEMMYQCALYATMPKKLVSKTLNCTLGLRGTASSVLYFDFDNRFSLIRFEQLVKMRIEKKFKRMKMRQQQAANATASIPDVSMDMLDDHDSLLSSYFASSEFTDIFKSILSRLLIFRAQTPQQALAAVLEAEFALKDCAEREAKIMALQTIEKKDGDAASTIKVSVPHYSLLLLDNISAFIHSVKGQSLGYAGIGTALNRATGSIASIHTNVNANDAATGATSTAYALAVAPMGSRASDPSSTWFYELFTLRIKHLLHTYRLIAVATKPPATGKQSQELQANFVHTEYLGMTWNSIVTYRISIREEREAQRTSAARRYVRHRPLNRSTIPGTREYQLQREEELRLAQRGVLRGGQLKNIAAAARGPNPRALMEFQFRIASEGISTA